VRALLIEDSPLKAGLIQAFVCGELAHIELSIERSYQSGLRRIAESPPEAVILDMSLPNFDVAPSVRHGKPRPLGGYDILRKIKRLGLTTKALVITQYESFGVGSRSYSFAELDAKCGEEFPGVFYGMVYFSPEGREWKSRLNEFLCGKGG
jgi:DNA-binding NarL/FixJ family response regulator